MQLDGVFREGPVVAARTASTRSATSTRMRAPCGPGWLTARRRPARSLFHFRRWMSEGEREPILRSGGECGGRPGIPTPCRMRRSSGGVHRVRGSPGFCRGNGRRGGMNMAKQQGAEPGKAGPDCGQPGGGRGELTRSRGSRGLSRVRPVPERGRRSAHPGIVRPRPARRAGPARRGRVRDHHDRTRHPARGRHAPLQQPAARAEGRRGHAAMNPRPPGPNPVMVCGHFSAGPSWPSNRIEETADGEEPGPHPSITRLGRHDFRKRLGPGEAETLEILGREFQPGTGSTSATTGRATGPPTRGTSR